MRATLRGLIAALAFSCMSTGCAQQTDVPADIDEPRSAVAPAGTLERPASGSDDPDLDKPWQGYRASIAQATKQLRQAIEGQRQAARAKGDLQPATRFKAMLEALDQKGQMPDCKELEKDVAAAQVAYKQAAEVLDKAYAAVVNKLTRDTSLDESVAQAVEDERKQLLASVGGGWQDITKDLIGGDRQAKGIVVNATFPRVLTKDSFKPPLEIEYVCMTEKNNIRLGYACTEIIFNWEWRPGELAINGGPAHGMPTRKGAGQVPVGQFLTIRQVVLPNEMSVFVDGQQRASWKANFSGIEEPIEVFRADSDLVIKTIRVKRLPKEGQPAAKQQPAAVAPPAKDALYAFARPLARPADGSKDGDLEKPWLSYKSATDLATAQLRDAIEIKRRAARANGDLEAASRLKSASEALDKNGEMPDGKELEKDVASTQDAYKRAAEDLDKAYAALVRKLTANTALDESVAQAVENERAALFAADKPIDLLPLIDLTGEATVGTWVRRDGEVRVSQGRESKTTINCRVPVEYDFVVEATCAGNTDFGQLCSVNDATVKWCVGAWGVVGFESVRGQSLQQAGKSLAGGVKPRTRYKSTVQVRRGRIAGLINDVEVVSHATDSTDLKVYPGWSIPKGRLGLTSFGAEVVFHKASLIPRQSPATKPGEAGSSSDQSHVGVLTRPAGGSKDPDLDKPWETYVASIKQATSRLQESIESRRQAARVKGDLDSAISFKEMLASLDRRGEMPGCKELEKDVADAKVAFKRAADRLDEAYAAVVKKLTIDTSLDESVAQAVEDERASLLSEVTEANRPKAWPEKGIYELVQSDHHRVLFQVSGGMIDCCAYQSPGRPWHWTDKPKAVKFRVSNGTLYADNLDNGTERLRWNIASNDVERDWFWAERNARGTAKGTIRPSDQKKP